MKHPLRKFWPTASLTALILYLVLTPDPPSAPELKLFEGADKVVHALMMGALAAVAIFDRYRAGMRVGTRQCAVVALCVMAFGVLTEILQGALTDTRSADVLDVLADWAGTLLAAAITPPFLKSVIKTNGRN